MANAVITTGAKWIKIDFGVYPMPTIHYTKYEIKGVEEKGACCIFMMNHRRDHTLSFDAQPSSYIVDTVNGVAPTSQADLVLKLVALIDY